MNSNKRKARKAEISNFRDKLISKKEKIGQSSNSFMKISDFFHKDQTIPEDKASKAKEEGILMSTNGNRDNKENYKMFKGQSDEPKQYSYKDKSNRKELEKILFPIIVKSSLGIKKGNNGSDITKLNLSEDEYINLKQEITIDDIDLFYNDTYIG